MAVPSYSTDLNDIYTDTDNFSTVGGGRVTATETDDYIQGNNCWSHDPFSSGIEGGAYDTVTGLTITSGDAVFIWTKCDVAATLATHANGGVQAIIGNSTNAYDCWYIRGSDDYQYGGWQCIPVDPTKTPSTTIGTPNGTLDWFGIRWNVPSTGASKGYPMKIDAIRHGRQIEVTAGDSGDPATWSKLAAYDATSTRQWGICQPTDSGAELQGVVYWGTASTATTFNDLSGDTITIIDTEWTDTDFTKIIIDHASTTFSWVGGTIKALGTNNPGQLVFNNASTVATLNGCVFGSIGITTLRDAVTATSSVWSGCGQITQNGATITGGTIRESSASSALLVDTASEMADITGVSFEDNNDAIIDTYSESNQVGGGTLYSGSNIKRGQSFYGGGTLNEATFILQKFGSPTGNATAVLYAHTGTFGSTGLPTGTALATSDTLDVSTLTTSYVLRDFTFSTPYEMTEGTPYFIAIEYSGGTLSNRIQVGHDATSPTHIGNGAGYDSSWSVVSGTDYIFYINRNATNTTQHSIELTSTGTHTFTDINFSGGGGEQGTNSTASTGSGTADVYNNSGGAITINVSGGDTPSVRNAASSTTTVNNNVTVTLTGLPTGVEVRIYEDDGAGVAGTEIDGIESTTGSTFPFSAAAAQDTVITIFDEDYDPVRQLYTVPSTNASLPYSLIQDGVYLNP